MKKRWMSVMLVGILMISVFALNACATGGETQESASMTPSEDASESQPAQSEEATGSVPDEAAAPAEPFDVLKDFTATDLDGNTVTQEIFSDYDLTMVNMWATFCGPCIDEMPELGELKKAYADQGVNVVGIVVDVTDGAGTVMPDGLALAKEIVAETGADYTHLLPSGDLMAVSNAVSVVPTTVFVDSEGNVVSEEYYGALDYDNWARVIDYLLDQS
jgi:thiol-disulfide isomerase/thioredoxin